MFSIFEQFAQNLEAILNIAHGTPRVILAVFAIFRIVGFLVFDDGPFNMFDKVRIIAGCYTYGPTGKPESNLGRMLSCAHCTGVWITGIVFFLVFIPSLPTDIAITFFGMAGAQSWLSSKN